MVVKITPNDKGNPAGKLADAELHFTDGALEEQKLLESVSAAKNLAIGSQELETAMTSWPSTYHLSPLRSNLFRIGASGLLTDIERQLWHSATGHYAATHHQPMP